VLEERIEQYIQSHPNPIDMGDMLYEQVMSLVMRPALTEQILIRQRSRKTIPLS